MAGKYDHIDFKPPKSVADAAARGLELRKKNKGRGGTDVGVQRAVNLKNRDELSPGTVKRMKAFFDRHQKSKKIDKGKSRDEDKGYIAWLLWGGDPGYSWSKKVVEQMEAADKKDKESKLINSLMKIADDLDQKGLYVQANRIDDLLTKNAVELWGLGYDAYSALDKSYQDFDTAADTMEVLLNEFRQSIKYAAGLSGEPEEYKIPKEILARALPEATQVLLEANEKISALYSAIREANA